MEINPRKFDSSRWVVAAHFFLLGNFSSTEGLFFFVVFVYLPVNDTISYSQPAAATGGVCVGGGGGRKAITTSTVSQ